MRGQLEKRPAPLTHAITRVPSRARSAPVVIQLAPLESAALLDLACAARAEAQVIGAEKGPDVGVGPVEDRVDADKVGPALVGVLKGFEEGAVRVVAARADEDGLWRVGLALVEVGLEGGAHRAVDGDECEVVPGGREGDKGLYLREGGRAADVDGRDRGEGRRGRRGRGGRVVGKGGRVEVSEDGGCEQVDEDGAVLAAVEAQCDRVDAGWGASAR